MPELPEPGSIREEIMQSPGLIDARSRAGRWPVAAAMLASILIVVGLGYARVLGYFFTATDTPALIDASRIRSPADLWHIVTEPLMSGTDFVEIARFYRPVTSLSYGFDHALWGLHPFGYHLTDLALHTAVCLAVAVLAWRLTGRRRIAWLGALIFASHPILVEIVPATARRHDVIATLFTLLSLIFFLRGPAARGRAAGGRAGPTIGSLICYLLALGAKEIAAVLPFLIGAQLWIYSPESRRPARLRESLRGALPYFAGSLVYFAWWGAVVEGGGGYAGKQAGMLEMIVILKSYLLSLAYPAGPIPFARLARAGAWVILLSAIACGVARRRRSPGATPGQSRGAGHLRALATASGLASAAAIAAYPLFAPAIARAVEQAYSGRGWQLLASLMDGRDSRPVEFYVDQFETVSTSLLALVMAASVALLLGLELHRRAARSRAHAETLGHLLFLAAWLALPLGVFLAARAFTHRNMYLPAVPFSLLLALVLVESAGAVRRYLAARSAVDGSGGPRAVAAAGMLVAACGMLVNLVAFSPVLRDYPEWRDSGEISRQFLSQLVEITRPLADGTRLRIHGLPDGVDYTGSGPRVRSATFLSSYSIESWLEMARPGHRFEVESRDRGTLSARPGAVRLELTRQDGRAVVTVEFEGSEPPATPAPDPSRG